MNNKRLKRKFLVLGLPALAGFVVLYIFPFIRTLWFSMVDNTLTRNFVFLDNYSNVLTNRFYQLALWNTFVFSTIGVVCLVVLSLIMSLGFLKLSRRFSFVRGFIIAPMILPTASVIFVWQMIFQDDSYTELIRNAANGTEFWTILPIYLLYLWKNTGISVIIISTAMAGIPSEVREAAALDGAGEARTFRLVVFPLITPNLLFVVVLSFVNALRNFRESYLFFRSHYPPDVAYTVQYYMNNQFQRLNYPNLTAGSVMFTFIIVCILLVLYNRENRYNERIY
jgi:multiple sugar transport system permease protein